MDGFEWDEAKRQQNIAQHGVDFLDAARIFKGAVVEGVDRRKDYGEDRILALGQVDEEWLLVVYTWRGVNRRIISAWKVGKDGQERYKTILDARD